MSGRPQRTKPKRSVQLRIDTSAYDCVLPLLQGEAAPRMSYSQLFESVLLLAKEEYTNNANRDFIGELCSMKILRVEEEMRTHRPMPRRNLHVTIDGEALGFLDMLVTRYHSVFRTRGDAASLMLLRIGQRIKTSEKIAWMRRRLEEIILKYPVRY